MLTLGDPLEESVSQSLDGSGNGTIYIGPSKLRDVWDVEYVIINTTISTSSPEVRLFGPNGRYLDGTRSGGYNKTRVNMSLYRGQKFRLEYTLGDPGATATVTVTGRVRVV